jgi:hypothetical protein
MQIHTHIIEMACGGLCRFLGSNEITPFMRPETYERMNAMACKHETRNMEKILNEETPDSWKVVFLQAETSVSRHKFLFVRVEGK